MAETPAQSWNAARYAAFETERTRPVRDLLLAVPLARADTVTDLGCGPGNSTQALSHRFPGAALTGVDSAPDMLAAARRRLPTITFLEEDIAAWSPATPQTLIFSNAALHWLPGHATLFPRLASFLAQGGVLAIQMPDNLAEPSHTLMQDIANAPDWSSRLQNAGAARTKIETPETYHNLLSPFCKHIEIWRTIYYLKLENHAAITRFYASTGLRPYLAPLSEPEQQDFQSRYTRALTEAYPALPNGEILLPTPRLFLIAQT